MTQPDLLFDNRLAYFEADTAHLGQATNSPVTIILPATLGQLWAIGLVVVSFSDTPTGAILTVFEGANPVFKVSITQSNPTPVPVYRSGAIGNPMTITLSAGGSGITGYLNVEAEAI